MLPPNQKCKPSLAEILMFTFAINFVVIFYLYYEAKNDPSLKLERDDILNNNKTIIIHDNKNVLHPRDSSNHEESINSLLDNLHQYTKVDKSNPTTYSLTAKVSRVIQPKYLEPNQPFLQSTIGINPICKYLMPDYTFFFVSHKNGVYLMGNVIRCILRYCNATGYYRRETGFLTSLNGVPYKTLALQQQYKNLISNGRKLKVLIQIRNPMDTMWSAWNYHKKCPEVEVWEHDKIRGRLGVNSQLCCVVRTELENSCPHSSRHIAWNDQRLINENGIKQTRYYIEDYVASASQNASYCEWLKMIDREKKYEIGLYIEFIRYINCGTGQNGWRYWKQIFVYAKQWNFVEYLRMNEWINEFENTANRFIDFVNLIDNEENKRILIDVGLNDINITNEREKILTDLKRRANINKWSVQRTNDSVHVNQLDEKYHIDKEKAFEWILNFKNICIVLKNITNYLDFPWIYSKC